MPLVTYLLGLLLSQGLLLLTALALLRPLAERLRRLDASRHRLAWGLVGAGAMLALAAELG
jgi:HAMP domain-containing protein